MCIEGLHGDNDAFTYQENGFVTDEKTPEKKVPELKKELSNKALEAIEKDNS